MKIKDYIYLPKDVKWGEYKTPEHLEGWSHSLYLIGAYENPRMNHPRYKLRFLKIGHTNNIYRRHHALSCSSPFKLKVISIICHDNKQIVCELEREFKRVWKPWNVHREWFHYDEMILEYFQEVDDGTW